MPDATREFDSEYKISGYRYRSFLKFTKIPHLLDKYQKSKIILKNKIFNFINNPSIIIIN